MIETAPRTLHVPTSTALLRLIAYRFNDTGKGKALRRKVPRLRRRVNYDYLSSRRYPADI